MIGQVEIREAADGPTLRGVMIQEGRAASGGRREVFAPGSVEWPSEGVGILTEHRGAPEIRAVPVRDDQGVIRIVAPATEAIRAAVDGGRRFMSVEFHALADRMTRGGVREILRALVPDVALVGSPEYDVTSAEVRRTYASSTRTRTFVPIGRRMDCKCGFKASGADEIEFDGGAFAGILAEIEDGRNVSAIARGAGDVVADTNTGSLRLAMAGGGLSVGIRALDTEAGRRVEELVEAGVDVHARPVIDFTESEFDVEGNVATVTAATFSYILVKPTDRVRGLQPLARVKRGENRRGLVRVTGPASLEGQETPLQRKGRRRIWL